MYCSLFLSYIQHYEKWVKAVKKFCEKQQSFFLIKAGKQQEIEQPWMVTRNELLLQLFLNVPVFLTSLFLKYLFFINTLYRKNCFYNLSHLANWNPNVSFCFSDISQTRVSNILETMLRLCVLVVFNKNCQVLNPYECMGIFIDCFSPNG